MSDLQKLVEDNQREASQRVILYHYLFESISHNIIIDSIKNRNVVKLDYHGTNPGGSGSRTIEPVCFGYSKTNKLLLRVWDYEGSSHTGFLGTQPLPGWRILRVDRISNYTPTQDIFNEIRPNYNSSGDKSISKIIVNANFGNITTPEKPIELNPEMPSDQDNNVPQLTEIKLSDLIF